MDKMYIRIKEIREYYKLTQDEFGKKIGSARNTIANYENGNRNPSNSVILSICREFNVNENWLRTGEGGSDNMLIKTSPYEKAYNRFGYIMENSIPSKKAVLSMLLELLYSVPDEQWDTIMKEYEEIKKED